MLMWWWVVVLAAAAAMESADLLQAAEELESINSLVEKLMKRRADLMRNLDLPNTALPSFDSVFVPKTATVSAAAETFVAFDLLRIPAPYSRRNASKPAEALYYTAAITASGHLSLFESPLPEPVLAGFPLQEDENNGESCMAEIIDMRSGVSNKRPFIVTLDTLGYLRIHGLNLQNKHQYNKDQNNATLTVFPRTFNQHDVTAFALHTTIGSKSTTTLLFALQGLLVAVDPANPESSRVQLALDNGERVTHISVWGNSIALAMEDGQIRFASHSPFKLLTSAATCFINPRVLGKVKGVVWVESNAYTHKNRFLIVTTDMNDVLLLDRKFQLDSNKQASKFLSLSFLGGGGAKRNTIQCTSVKRLHGSASAQVFSLPGDRFLHYNAHSKIMQVFGAQSFAPESAASREEGSVAVRRASLGDECFVMVLANDGSITVMSLLYGNARNLAAAAQADTWFQPQKFLLPGLIIVAVAFQVMKKFSRRPSQQQQAAATAALLQSRSLQNLFVPTTASTRQDFKRRRQARVQQQYFPHDEVEEEEEEYALPPQHDAYESEHSNSSDDEVE